MQNQGESTESHRFPVSVLTAFREAGKQPWDTGRWEVIAVVAGARGAAGGITQTPVHGNDGGRQVLWSGYHVDLYQDAADSYYFNLMGERPSIFVVCRQDDEGALEPAHVTLSYDEADSHLEVDEPVFALPMPPELYRWAEAYVLANYVPEQRKKRKRKDWKRDAGSGECPI